VTVPTADPFSGVQLSALPAAHPALLEAARVRPASRFKGPAEPVLDDASRPGAERRRARRFRVAYAAPAWPVDSSGRPTGEPFSAVVADLSASGIRLLHSRFVKADHLAVRVPMGGEPTTLVLKVVRIATVGRHYEFSGPLVVRLGGPPEERREVPPAASPARQVDPGFSWQQLEPLEPQTARSAPGFHDEPEPPIPVRPAGLPMARKLPSATRPPEPLPAAAQ
jgi:hypothetical protein